MWRSKEGNFTDDVVMRRKGALVEIENVQREALGLCTIGFRKDNRCFNSVNVPHSDV